RVPVRLQPGPYPPAGGLGGSHTRVACPPSQERLQFPALSSLSSCGPPEPAQPANVLLRGLRAEHPCRPERGSESSESSGRSGASRLRRPPSDQGSPGKTTPGLAKWLDTQRLGVVQPPAQVFRQRAQV